MCKYYYLVTVRAFGLRWVCGLLRRVSACFPAPGRILSSGAGRGPGTPWVDAVMLRRSCGVDPHDPHSAFAEPRRAVLSSLDSGDENRKLHASYDHYEDGDCIVTTKGLGVGKFVESHPCRDDDSGVYSNWLME